MSDKKVTGRILVSRTWVLPTRNSLVIEGEITNGSAKAGSDLVLPLNRSTTTALKIHSVEFVYRTQPQSSTVALLIQFENSEDAELMQGICVSAAGEVLDVH
jgi:hypothetical protein